MGSKSKSLKNSKQICKIYKTSLNRIVKLASKLEKSSRKSSKKSKKYYKKAKKYYRKSRKGSKKSRKGSKKSRKSHKKHKRSRRFGKISSLVNIMGNNTPSDMTLAQQYMGKSASQAINHLENIPDKLRDYFYTG